MERIRGKLGFGFMRLPMQGDEVDLEQTSRMVDAFLGAGFNYFDTAHGYINGKSEQAIRACLTSRHPRESYVLANKLSYAHFEREEDIRPLFEQQLEICGVEYFDLYLMHAQSARSFPKYKACRAYETALELKAEGKLRHLAISFHDSPQVLDQILTEYPQIEAVQIQLNYVDMEDPDVQSRGCYEVCRKHGKPVIIMEPVKGGNLADLPEEARGLLEASGCSSAGWALRFAAGFEGVMTVLSGMGSPAMVEENAAVLGRFKPLDAAELAVLDRVCLILKAQGLISCTDCRYCVEVCPKKLNVPAIFKCVNRKKQFANWDPTFAYEGCAPEGRRASDCLGCGACEQACPQHLPIRELLAQAAGAFESGER